MIIDYALSIKTLCIMKVGTYLVTSKNKMYIIDLIPMGHEYTLLSHKYVLL